MDFNDAIFRDTLFSGSPAISRLRSYLTETHNLNSKQADEVIYQVVLRLNLSLFHPITKLELFLAEGCNLACKYCFEKDMSGDRLMSLPVAKKALDLFFDYSQGRKELFVTYFGGEPTLNFKVMQQATEYAEIKALQRGQTINFAVTTNAVLLNQSMVGYFSKHNIKALLSIDGLEKAHDRFRLDKNGRGTFAQVLKGLKTLKKVQPWIGARMTVMPENVESLFDDVLGLYQLGVNQFIIAHATNIKWSSDDIQAYCDQTKRLMKWYKKERRADLKITAFDDKADENPSFFGCQAGRNTISISSTGGISPCSKILALNNKKLLVKLGNLTYGLTHFYNRKAIVDCSKLREECEVKGITEDFHGGCFATNYCENKDVFKPSIQEYNINKAYRKIVQKACDLAG
jgi:uncharacterized protein